LGRSVAEKPQRRRSDRSQRGSSRARRRSAVGAVEITE
jgi:hypothetical protein